MALKAYLYFISNTAVVILKFSRAVWYSAYAFLINPGHNPSNISAL